jgi:hypothetical protein
MSLDIPPSTTQPEVHDSDEAMPPMDVISVQASTVSTANAETIVNGTNECVDVGYRGESEDDTEQADGEEPDAGILIAI